MAGFTDFEHFDVAADLDFASWDSYPLGFLASFPLFLKHTAGTLCVRAIRTMSPFTMTFIVPAAAAVGG